jgi:hypothetical protein
VAISSSLVAVSSSLVAVNGSLRPVTWCVVSGRLTDE